MVIKVGEKESLAYRSSRHVLPTPESPIINSLICMSKGFSCRAILKVGMDGARGVCVLVEMKEEEEEVEEGKGPSFGVCLLETREKNPCR